LTRISLGDRSALEESFEFFNENKKFENECHRLPKVKKRNCNSLQSTQWTLMYRYATRGTKRGQDLMKAVAAGELPWLHSSVIDSAKNKLKDIVTPKRVIEIGDYMSTRTLTQLPPHCFNYKNVIPSFMQLAAQIGIIMLDMIIKIANIFILKCVNGGRKKDEKFLYLN